MRCGIIVMVFLSLLATPALASTAYDDVPKEHWSYDCLEYLMDEGFLPSAHMGQFDRNEILTNCDMTEYAKLVHSIFSLGQPDSISDETWNLTFIYARNFVAQYSSNITSTSCFEVPKNHWSYDALDYLSRNGILEGYSENYFTSDRRLTRYEIAQAVARLWDSLGSGNGEIVYILAESLREEYSDQLAEINWGFVGASKHIQGFPPD